MKRFLAAAAAVAAGLAIGCVGRQDRNSNIATDRGGGASISAARSPLTIVGCLQAGDRPGTYRLVSSDDPPDRPGASPAPTATAGHVPRPPTSTTGQGGDAIADSPTIGSGVLPRTYLVVPAGINRDAIDRQVGAEVSVVGEIEDEAIGDAGANGARPTRGIRASALTRVADRCSIAPAR